jgi:hypothetical protein
MDDPKDTAEETESERRTANLILLTLFLVVVAIGVWLVFALDTARQADDCLSAGRRDCVPLTLPSR